MQRQRALRSIVVLGGGIVGLTAAIAFARALHRVRITVIDVPPDPAALADRLPGSLPAIAPFHVSIGIDERDLVRTGAATHRIATRFEHWSADGAAWYHAYGDHGLPAGSVPFHQLWVAAQRAGGTRPFHDHAAAAAMAAAGKFVHPEQDSQSPLGTHDYALRLDPERYRERLAAQAERLRVLRARGVIATVERRGDGGIARLVLDDGRRFEADLFLDCAGPAGRLISAVGSEFEDWGDSLPCDRLLLGTAPAQAEPTSCDMAVAAGIGWHWAAFLPDRTMAGLAYSSLLTSEDEARSVAAQVGIATSGPLSIRPGRRRQPWVRNVLAIGDAAIAVDPLESTNLHLAQSAIARALDLLPGRDCHPLELAEYNRRTAQQAERIRDFLALHYLAAPRRDGPFWASMAARGCPESLAHTLQQFRSRGRLPFFEEESFTSDSWLAVLFGMGLLPAHVSPAAGALDPEQGKEAMLRLGEGVAGLPARLPSYRDYLARMKGGG